jgi:hypothetical protein
MLTNQTVGRTMAEFQPEVAGVVIPFARYSAAHPVAGGDCLSPRDRMDAAGWQDAARLAGYDRMVIHDRDEGDAMEVGNFLSVHRRGEAWSRWGFARRGAAIRAWCCLTGADVGEFTTLGEALTAVLHGMSKATSRRGAARPASRPDRHSAIVTDLMPRLVQRRLGSAA